VERIVIMPRGNRHFEIIYENGIIKQHWETQSNLASFINDYVKRGNIQAKEVYINVIGSYGKTLLKKLKGYNVIYNTYKFKHVNEWDFKEGKYNPTPTYKILE
jgi:hypothetical protein